MTGRTVAKDFYRLQRNVNSFSNGEARVTSFDDELTKFEVELNIKDGYYKDGIFSFEVSIPENYPDQAPTVCFNSEIFHPNIGDGYENGIVCLNLLSDDWQANDLEDVVQGMLFLVKNPALDDALNPLFSEFYDDFGEDMEYFATLVRKTLEGGEVEGVEFQRNPGLVQKDKILEDSKMVNTEDPPVIAPEKYEMTNSTIDNTNPALALRINPAYPDIHAMNISSKDELYRCGLFWIYRNFSTNGKAACRRGGCPKWLARLAALMFDGTTKSNEHVNIFSRNLRTFQRFPFFKRTLMWHK